MDRYIIIFMFGASWPQIRSRLLGSISLDWIVVFYLPIIILTPCYTYYMCVIKNK